MLEVTEDNRNYAAPLLTTLRTYLYNASIAVLGFPKSAAGGNSFEDDILVRFISTDEPLVYIEKIQSDESLTLHSSLKPSSRTLASVAFVKNRDGPLDMKIPLPQQLQVMSTGGGGNLTDSGASHFSLMQQFTRYLFSPIVRFVGSNVQTAVGDTSESTEHLSVLSRLRELDLALEQCQRGSLIPKVILRVPGVIETAASKAAAPTIKNILEKYNPAQVDELFDSLQLTATMGDTSEQNEAFANEVNDCVKIWPADILRLARFVDCPFPSSADREILFWNDYEKKLWNTKDQLNSPGVLLTKLILKRTNRVSEQLLRDAELELDKSLEIAQSSVSFFSDFRLDDLISATDFTQVSKAVTICLQYLTRIRHSKYDFSRMIRLLEVFGIAVYDKIVNLLQDKNILQSNLEAFKIIFSNCEQVFIIWETHFSTIKNILKDIAKRKGEKLKGMSFNHELLQQRLKAIFEFREQHERMINIFSVILPGEENSILTELAEAYKLLLRDDWDFLDVSNNGQSSWSVTIQMYEKRLTKTEERITLSMEHQLSAAQTADEMFHVFSVFSPLFFRSCIRKSVNSFRATLVKNVREDVKKLQEKFKLRYDDSQEKVTADLRDVPPLSGRIIWARQIENQLTTLMQRMEGVLGAEGWENYQEGKQLREVCDELRSYLDIDQLYKDWLSQQMKTENIIKYSKSSDFVLLVEDDHRSAKVLRVNFDPKQVILFKEVRYLDWLLPELKLSKSIPATIRTLANEAYARFPVSMALEAALAGFSHAKQNLTSKNVHLLVTHLVSVRDCIKEAIGGSKQSKKWIKWDSNDLNEWVGRLSHKVYAFEERVNDICDKLLAVDNYLLQLQNSAYERENLECILHKLQLVIDDTRMRGYSNVQSWVAAVDSRIEQIIFDRLKRAIIAWVQAFRGIANVTDSDDLDPLRYEDAVSLPMTLHQILMSNQRMYLSPPLEESRVEFINNYHSHISVLCTLPRVISTRYDVFAVARAESNDYSSIMQNLPADLSGKAYMVIEEHLGRAKLFVKEWIHYQLLWDVPISALGECASQDLPKWQRLLSDIKSSRAALDSADEEEVFGAIVINYRQVQGKIDAKYDVWQKEAQKQFANILSNETEKLSVELNELKDLLDNSRFEGNSKEIIDGVRALLKLKTKLLPFKSSCATLESSEKFLLKQRFQFPDDWTWSSKLTNTLTALQQVYALRSAFLDAEMPNLVNRINEESLSVAKRVSDLLSSWDNEKPRAGFTPEQSLRVIARYHAQANKLKLEEEEMVNARAALGVEGTADNRASELAEELVELTESWSLLGSILSKFSSIRECRFRDIDSVRVRKQLDDLNEELRQLPAKVHNSSSYENLQDRIISCLGQQLTLRDIKSEALQDRHIRQIFKVIGVDAETISDVTLGMLWDSNMATNHSLVVEVLGEAQGEYALDMYIAKIKEYWMTAELTLTTRESVQVITEWDRMFNVIEDDLNSLASMKQSPYFATVKQFQEESATWEGKITALRAIFTVWVEVQRKWLYLRGIFRNEDIKIQLPSQFATFKTTDNEQITLMRKVHAQPSCLGLLLFENLAKQLERCDATMILIQKSLIDFLDSQREIFPRYYFVNNNDLIEIIGNSNEPSKIITHLGEMFAGVVSVELSPSLISNKTCIDKMCSKEGEVIGMITPVDVSTAPTLWLGSFEKEIVNTLALLLQKCMKSVPSNDLELLRWIDDFPAQIGILSSQVAWCSSVEKALDLSSMASVLSSTDDRLKALSEAILSNLSAILRKKCEQLITEIVHQRDVARLLISSNVRSSSSFSWRYHLRIYWNIEEQDLTKQLSLNMSNAAFYYGFEYQGIGERLVQTPLTDRCYLTLTQALHLRLGGCPFGPAGTGKTESVKMLGSQLGRLVLVFNCDENFDYASMGRIFAGLCRVGAWGCFDEFNRLEARILSAVSQQILNIQKGLISKAAQVELMNNKYKLNPNVGIFITMNPGYAGRSELPDNLKQLFRAVAMAVPDLKLITQVMLYSQGIVSAESLAGKTVLLFTLCSEQLSSQSHYDFGLRALKSVLTGAGELKRNDISSNVAKCTEELETDVLVRSLCNSIVPKLVSEDVPLFASLFESVFPGLSLPSAFNAESLTSALEEVCGDEMFDFRGEWAEKVLQLKQVLDVRHGVMLVGPSGNGKSSAWKCLIKALTKVDKVKGDYYVIDPKAISKSKLFGTLDPNTFEWVDGIFTKLLRKFIDAAAAGSAARRSWIIFDGDVDPEWAENLNSVLDDNKILTLPTGDRLKIPPNVRIIFEVDSLRYATLATVSRCGMVWFPDAVVPLSIKLKRLLQVLSAYSPTSARSTRTAVYTTVVASVVEKIKDKFIDGGIVATTINYSLSQIHIMTITVERLLSTLLSFLYRCIDIIVESNESNSSMSDTHLTQFISNWLLYSLLWACGSSMDNKGREELSAEISSSTDIITRFNGSILDMRVNEKDGSFQPWATIVQSVDLPGHKISTGDVVIPTTDTARHEAVLTAWISSRKPLILCGPPGSGKTMTLTAVIQAMPNLIVAQLDFSSSTNPELILKVFAQYCEVVDSPEGLTMQPNSHSYSEEQWLLVFCDEINLPETDKYGTQKVITFIRQLTEQGGFWNHDCKWINLKRIQFIGACNPPTDTGRVALTNRFLRFTSVLLVDYPAEESLKQIYKTFNSAILRSTTLSSQTDSLTNAMIQFYIDNHNQFKPETAPQYIYSPRELSRWIRALNEAIILSDPKHIMCDDLIRIWAGIGYHLFQDRLVTDSERQWCDSKLKEVATKHFIGANVSSCLLKPIMYVDWISGKFQSCKLDDIRDFISTKLKIFYEEVLDVPLVVFDDLIEHVIRIDSVLKNPLGHLLLAGEAGVGKTVLSRFVAWLNGQTVFQIKASSRYTIQQFDDDLRSIFRRVGIEGEKICFIFDESNALSSAFLERMNALLASGEVPGLFEGDDRAQLLTACRDSFVQRDGLILNSDEQIWRQFVKYIQRNLHVVFTMNPANADYHNRSSTSPALYNRCVVDWFGTWSTATLSQVAFEFISKLPSDSNYRIPDKSASYKSVVAVVKSDAGPGLREGVVTVFLGIYNGIRSLSIKIGKNAGRQHYVSPRDYLDMVNKFNAIKKEKHDLLLSQQKHIRNGLKKLEETQEQVACMRIEMERYSAILKEKDAEANMKLNQVVENQKEATSRKEKAENISAILLKQTKEIDKRREEVQKELDKAAPELNSAKEGVKNIRKTEFNEVKTLSSPPTIVRLVMELVVVLMGEKQKDWMNIKKVIRGDDFLQTILNYDPNTLSLESLRVIEAEYLQNPDLTQEAVNRGSKACAPLYQWAMSQISYSMLLAKLAPLYVEIDNLMMESSDLAGKYANAVKEVEQMENVIEKYKADYAAAVREHGKVKSDMERTTEKTNRAESLLGSLENEKIRWGATSISFETEMITVVGDSILSAAFLTFGGIFDQNIREKLQEDWSNVLEENNIEFRNSFDPVNYLASATNLVNWSSYGLSNDSVSLQNAVLIERFTRYPLIVDPSGLAITFILKRFANSNINSTSFLEPGFLKALSTSVRFGTPILIRDAEFFDPIVNPLLNKEVQKINGRLIIRIGNDEIDFSPRFFVILATRDPAAHFPPDLCSRVTLVNFSVTASSLTSQTLSSVLRAERPDIDSKRTELIKLLFEQQGRLRELEESILRRIGELQGAILDDDTFLSHLEESKKQALKIESDVKNSGIVMAEISAVSSQYDSIALLMTRTYFALSSMSKVNVLYQFSLDFFFEIVSKVLTTTTGDDPPARRESLKLNFVRELSRRVMKGLTFADQRLMALKITMLHAQCEGEEVLTPDEMYLLYHGTSANTEEFNSDGKSFIAEKFPGVLPGRIITDSMARGLLSLFSLPVFVNLPKSLTEGSIWDSFFNAAYPEKEVPMTWCTDTKISSLREALLKTVIIRCLIPSRIVGCIDMLADLVFNSSWKWREDSSPNLKRIASEETKAASPILLCCGAGQDASAKVESLAQELGRNILTVAMGSKEGFEDANKCISNASKTGDWVLLRNIHLCGEWLVSLDKCLQGMHLNSDFRLFFTCNINGTLPTELIRRSDLSIYEASTGVKANLVRFFKGIPISRINRKPLERIRLYTLLGWLDAIVQERLRYSPIGWSKKYEFSEADAIYSLEIIDQWLDELVNTEVVLSPSNLPWEALRVSLSQSYYGGRIDNKFDQAALDSFIDFIFNASMFDSLAPIAVDYSENGKGAVIIRLPSALTYESLTDWISALPDVSSPEWLGLPSSSENLLQSEVGQAILANLFKVDQSDSIEQSESEMITDTNTSFVQMSKTISCWKNLLPKVSSLPIVPSNRLSDSSISSMERCLAREVAMGAALLKIVLSDLDMLINFLNGKIPSTNRIRSLIKNYSEGEIPHEWAVGTSFNQNVPIGQWIVEFAKRTSFLENYRVILNGESMHCIYWIGGMFSAESFVTATRQMAAQNNKWSLEDVELHLDISCLAIENVQDSIVEGLVLVGANWSGASIILGNELKSTLPKSRMRWKLKSSQSQIDAIILPVYLDETRRTKIMDVIVRTPTNVSKHVWFQRGVALLIKG